MKHARVMQLSPHVVTDHTFRMGRSLLLDSRYDLDDRQIVADRGYRELGRLP